MHFSLIDWVVILLYLIGMIAIGLWKGGTQRSASDYFLSDEKMAWWKVAAAIVATETSAVTFISLPGIAYKGNWTFLQLGAGYILGRVIVAGFFLPRYYQGELTTAYALLERQFGKGVRKLSAVTFMLTRLFADGVRLYVTAIPLALIFRGYALFEGVDERTIYLTAIGLSAFVTLIYVLLGGIRAVIWTDMMQLFIYLLGGVIAASVMLTAIPFASVIDVLGSEKTQVFRFESEAMWRDPYAFLTALFGGAIFTMASHGTDYIIIQRLFTTPSLSESKRALIASGVMVVLQFALFLFIGTLLFLFYGHTTAKADEVFPQFIITHMPTGLAGLLVAGLLAAAMSTLSGSISAISSSTIFDLYADTEAGQRASDEEKLTLSRRISVVWTGLLALSAVLFMGMDKSVVEVALSIASFTYGGLLGLFLLAIFFNGISPKAAGIGFVVSVGVMTVVVTHSLLAWTLYTAVGAAMTLLVAVSISRAFPKYR